MWQEDRPKLRFGLEECGIRQRVNIDFEYQGKTLKWRRYVRPPIDPLPAFLENLVEDTSSLRSEDRKPAFHRLRLTIYPNNTYAF